MHKDTTAFRARFNKYKAGAPIKELYNAGRPIQYDGGKGEDLEYLIDNIIKEEGFISAPKNIGDGKITIGSGLTDQKWLDLYRKKGKWTAEDNRRAVREEVFHRRKKLAKEIPHWDEMSPGMKDTLTDIAYNVGSITSKNSPKFLAHLKNKEWEAAAREMDWGARQYDEFPGLRDRNARRQAQWLEGIKDMKPVSYLEKYSTPQYPQPVFTNQDYPLDSSTPEAISSWKSPQSPAYRPSDVRPQFILNLPDAAELWRNQIDNWNSDPIQISR